MLDDRDKLPEEIVRVLRELAPEASEADLWRTAAKLMVVIMAWLGEPTA